jgi:MFS family permease
MEKSQMRPAISAFLLMLTISLISTGLSFFVTPVCEELGFGRGSFTLYYSLIVAAGAVSASFLGTYMNKHGVRGVMLVSAVWCCAGFVGFSFSGSLWMFYILGGAIGLLGSTCLYLAANVIVQQSYSSRQAATVLGLVMAGSGIGGVIWSNVVPILLETFGWRVSYRFIGLFWLVLPLAAALILGKQEMSGMIGHAKSVSGGTSKKDALKSLRFYLAVLVMCILSAASCISQQLPAILTSLGEESRISFLISVMTAFAAVGTIAEGLLCSKLGIQKTMVLVLSMYVVGFLLLAFGGNVVIALICLAFGAGSIGTLMPIVVRTIFGGRDYAAIWSIVISCSSVASFVATPVWGMVYDVFGTYTPALFVMPVLLGLAVLAIFGAFKNVEV